jgi:DNA-directed RNA polymerase subunit RPC12/RpoP
MAIAGISTDDQPSQGQMENGPEQEQQSVVGKEIKCPYCGSDRLELLERLPRPRSRSPSAEMLARFYKRGSIAV